ncbi:MAG: hypothetical protein V1807_01765 [Patescibacteria group bacterium]
MSMSDDEWNEEEFAVKSRKGNFSFWQLNLGMGSPLGATRLAEQMGGKEFWLLWKATDPSTSLRMTERVRMINEAIYLI